MLNLNAMEKKMYDTVDAVDVKAAIEYIKEHYIGANDFWICIDEEED